MPNALVEELALSKVPGPATPSAPITSREPRWLTPLVLLAAAALSIYVYAWFWQHSRDIWWWIAHDRHAHYMYGLNLAWDVRTGDWARLAHDFDRMREWGPLHAVLVALVEIVGGPDHRLAVLPSLLGWFMTMGFAFLIPRRMLSSGGSAAGLIAAFLVAVSPAHRAFATDVMYESLGAGFSLAAIYFYLGVIQKASPRSGIMLGLTLSALFLHKYNYWLLVVFGLVAGEFVRQPRAWFDFALSLCRRDRLPSWLLTELKHPLNYVALAFVGAAIAVVMTGGGTISLAGRSVSVHEPHNFIHLAYVAFFVRWLLWWRQSGQALSLQFPKSLRDIFVWHGCVVALWFLLPKRLSYFFWYLSPANSDQHRESVPFMHGLPYYLQGLQEDYLTLHVGVYLFVGMLILGFLCCRAFKPGTAALLCFFLIATYLTCQHPMLKTRFVHSWIAAGWVIGAAGLIQTVSAFSVAAFVRMRGIPPGGADANPHSQECGYKNGSSTVRSWSTWAVCVALLGLHSPALLKPGHAAEGGLSTRYPSPLIIPDTYLPYLADAKNPTIFCNVSTRFMLTWTFIEYHGHQQFTADIKNYKAQFEDNPEQIASWLEKTRSDTLVVIDVHPGTMFEVRSDEYVDLTALKQVLERQSDFTAARRWELPEGVTITLWHRLASRAP